MITRTLTMELLSLLGLLGTSRAQDAGTVAFPSYGNGSSFELTGKVEQRPFYPDPMRSQPPPPPPPPLPLMTHMTMPPDYYLQAYRPPMNHRSENLPYAFEYPSYPVSQAAEHSIGASSKHLVIASFIGLLLLFAIIQNTIVTTKKKDALIDLLPSRRKRDSYAMYNFNSVTPEAEDILNDDARVRCIQRLVCLENRRLFKDLGTTGEILAKYLTWNVEKSLDSSSGWARLVQDAGAAGMRGDDCNVLYRDCDIFEAPKMRKRSDRSSTGVNSKSPKIYYGKSSPFSTSRKDERLPS